MPMKSTDVDEIRLDGWWVDLISLRAKRTISSEGKARGFHRGAAAISLKQGDNCMAENKLADLSTEFAVRILNLTDSIKGHYSLTNQLERSGTSIGANLREAKYAHSKADFVAKLQISLKECYETEYWLEILYETEYIDKKLFDSINSDCQELIKLLVSITKTQKQK